LLAALFSALLARWAKASDHAARQRAERMVAALMVLDVFISFYTAIHIDTPRDLKSWVTWPRSLVAHYQSDTRWVVIGSMLSLNQALVNNVDAYNGYDPASSAQYFRFAGSSDGNLNWGAVYEPLKITPVLAVAGVTHVLAQGAPPPATSGTHLSLVARDGHWKLWQVHYPRGIRAYPRTYLTDRLLSAPAGTPREQQSLANMANTPGTDGLPALVAQGSAGILPALPAQPGPAPTAQQISVLVNTPTHHEWLTESGKAGLLVNCEARTPGWHAYVDGRATELIGANLLFRGVRVAAGRHRVVMVFDSSTYRFGLFVTLCSLGALGGLGATLISKKRR
jgi:hypothetical protein